MFFTSHWKHNYHHHKEKQGNKSSFLLLSFFITAAPLSSSGSSSLSLHLHQLEFRDGKTYVLFTILPLPDIVGDSTGAMAENDLDTAASIIKATVANQDMVIVVHLDGVYPNSVEVRLLLIILLFLLFLCPIYSVMSGYVHKTFFLWILSSLFPSSTEIVTI